MATLLTAHYKVIQVATAKVFQPPNSVSESLMVPKKRIWTSDENERLKASVVKGVSIIKVAAALKRNIISVRTQARKLGTPFPPMKDYRKQFNDSSESSRRPY
jgi:hypothetical protein